MALWLVALIPIAVVLVGMVGLRWSGARAGTVSWVVALGLAVVFFGAGPSLLANAQLKSILLSLYVLYIIWMALLFYHVVNEAGVIKTLAAKLPGLTADKGLQVLVLAWAFGSFLQGVSGFGVPTAVVAPLLVGVGLGAEVAVVAAGLGHAWAVTFGSLASSFLALMAATGRGGPELASESAIMLGLACFACGVAVLWAVGGARMAVGHWWQVLVVGSVMSVTQYAVAQLGVYTLAAAAAGLAGLGATVLLARLRRSTSDPPETPPPLSLGWALFPYIALIVIVGSANLVGPLSDFLDGVMIRIRFPELTTALGYTTPAETGRTISVFGHAGALLLYTSLISYAVFRARGNYSNGAARRIVRSTVKGSINSTIGILTMVAMAVTMEHAGMTRALAEGLATAAGSTYPAIAAFIGALGAFMTGSNTNSNVVFASLQDQTAQLLGYAPVVILAAQTTGGAIGGAFAPAKVILGCSTVGLGGREGPVVKATLIYGLVILIIVGVMAFAWVGVLS